MSEEWNVYINKVLVASTPYKKVRDALNSLGMLVEDLASKHLNPSKKLKAEHSGRKVVRHCKRLLETAYKIDPDRGIAKAEPTCLKLLYMVNNNNKTRAEKLMKQQSKALDAIEEQQQAAQL